MEHTVSLIAYDLTSIDLWDRPHVKRQHFAGTEEKWGNKWAYYSLFVEVV